MVDVLYKHAPRMCAGSYDIITRLSDENFATILKEFNPLKTAIPSEHLHAFFKRVPPREVRKFILPITEYAPIYYGSARSELISVIAQYTAFEDLGMLKMYLDDHNYGRELYCMSCNNRTTRRDGGYGFKNRSGYSYHRSQVCDPEGKFPNLTEILGKRLMERK